MSALLENLLAELNKNIFYREFSFSTNQFTPAPGETKEFADHVVWIDDLLVIYQLKQRVPRGAISDESERKWFKREVVNKATRQIRDTLGFLQQHPDISITNQRGHVFNVSSGSLRRVIKLVVYEPSAGLPPDCFDVKHHTSRTGGGFIHILPWDDYLGVCQTLVTPAEVAQYFDFREAIVQRWLDQGLPSESALLGQFLTGQDDSRPVERSADYLEALRRDSEDFDISYLLDGIGDRLEYYEGQGSDLDYYAILAEFAKLNRLELREVKKRVALCLEAVTENRYMAPTRIISEYTGCGFVFIPVEREFNERRIVGLKNLAQGAKYEQRLRRQIGVSFAKEGNEFLIDWGLLDYLWQFDSALEAWLQDVNPFRPLRREVRGRYEFYREKLKQ